MAAAVSARRSSWMSAITTSAPRRANFERGAAPDPAGAARHHRGGSLDLHAASLGRVDRGQPGAAPPRAIASGGTGGRVDSDAVGAARPAASRQQHDTADRGDRTARRPRASARSTTPSATAAERRHDDARPAGSSDWFSDRTRPWNAAGAYRCSSVRAGTKKNAVSTPQRNTPTNATTRDSVPRYERRGRSRHDHRPARRSAAAATRSPTTARSEPGEHQAHAEHGLQQREHRVGPAEHVAARTAARARRTPPTAVDAARHRERPPQPRCARPATCRTQLPPCGRAPRVVRGPRHRLDPDAQRDQRARRGTSRRRRRTRPRVPTASSPPRRRAGRPRWRRPARRRAGALAVTSWSSGTRRGGMASSDAAAIASISPSGSASRMIVCSCRPG